MSRRVLLTTAFCVVHLKPADVQVYLGFNAHNKSNQTSRSVSDIVIHPNYNSNTYDNNLAILILEKKLTATDLAASTIQPIPLCAKAPPVSHYIIVSAYGEDKNYEYPVTLQKTSLQLYGTKVCQQYKNNKLTNSMFCAGDPAGKRDLCPEDQGSPGVHVLGKCLYGIYNWGCSCGLAAPDSPSSPVFTNLVYLRSFVNKYL